MLAIVLLLLVFYCHTHIHLLDQVAAALPSDTIDASAHARQTKLEMEAVKTIMETDEENEQVEKEEDAGEDHEEDKATSGVAAAAAYKDDSKSKVACVDEDQRCLDWASRGECKVNQRYMYQHCRKSCRACSVRWGVDVDKDEAEDDDEAAGPATRARHKLPLKDEDKDEEENEDEHGTEVKSDGKDKHAYYEEQAYKDEARHWHTEGRAEKHTKEHNTVQQLAIHKAPEACSDLHDGCAGWHSMGECTKNPGYMLKACRKSCQACTLGTSAVQT